ncbi:MAG: hypothetical protein KAV45_12490 [Calditrichia bacterium]|nr:hypothetical protein [Calditrichia bacterium]
MEPGLAIRSTPLPFGISKIRICQKLFFLFAAYTSPHWPLQAPEEFVTKYRGRYSLGYDSLRSLRFESLKKWNYSKGVVIV